VTASRRILTAALGLLLAFATSAAAFAQTDPAAPAHVGPDYIYPDPLLTPGGAFSEVTAEQICVAGYARSVRSVSQSISEATWRAAITPAGGEVLGADW